jgi:hypothetical protein
MWGHKDKQIADLNLEVGRLIRQLAGETERADSWRATAGGMERTLADVRKEAARLADQLDRACAVLERDYGPPPAPVDAPGGPCLSCGHDADHGTWGCSRDKCPCPIVPWLAPLNKAAS